MHVIQRLYSLLSEGVNGGVLLKKIKKTFLKMSQVSQENTCAGVSF